MKERIPFQGKGDELQYRIDGLPPIVRGYLSLGEVLKNPTLDNETQIKLREERFNLFNKFEPQDKALLINFIESQRKEDKKK